VAQVPKVTVRFRDIDGKERATELGEFWPLSVAASLVPFRRFHSRKGQSHLPGTYWSSTVQDHVAYESRLELSRLLLADHDPTVRLIRAQPFQLQASIRGKNRLQIPDFLLLHTDGSVTIVNVKPVALLADPAVRESVEWPRLPLVERGWRYEIWSSVNDTLLSNVRFLAGYRRRSVVDDDIVQAVLASADGLSISQVEARLSARWATHLIRPAILHLVWMDQLRCDLTRPLGGNTRLAA
jgi:hypothetical protein